MKYVGTYNGNEMTVLFTARAEKNDYGVSSSPVWYEIVEDSIEIHSLEILGVDVDPSTLPQEVQKNLLDLSDEVEFDHE